MKKYTEKYEVTLKQERMADGVGQRNKIKDIYRFNLVKLVTEAGSSREKSV